MKKLKKVVTNKTLKAKQNMIQNLLNQEELIINTCTFKPKILKKSKKIAIKQRLPFMTME